MKSLVLKTIDNSVLDLADVFHIHWVFKLDEELVHGNFIDVNPVVLRKHWQGDSSSVFGQSSA